MLKALGGLVAAVAVGLGVVKQTQPELFLKIPNVGFIFYAVIAGGHVPPYFDNTPYVGSNFREWVRDGDVIVSTGAKSGTTWMCYCTHAIRTKGSDEVGKPYTDIMYSTPWMELTQKPGETWEQRKHLMNSTVLPDGSKLKDYWDNEAYPFRVFKSHYMPDTAGEGFEFVLPVRKYQKVKYIVATRDGLEVGRSLWSFFNDHNPGFRSLWGGFPPVVDNPSAAVKDLMAGGNLYGLYFPYVKGWWSVRNDPNVLLMHYSDMVKDTPALVRKLAEFLEVSLSETEFEKTVEKCSFDHMKANAHLFDYKLPLATDTGVDTIMETGKQISKGKTGASARAAVSDELKASWEAAVASEFEDEEMRNFALLGGPWKRS